MIVGNRGTPLLRGTKPIGYYAAKPRHLILRYTDGVIPDFAVSWDARLTQISVLPNIWDVFIPDTNWSYLLYEQYELLEVIDANFKNVTTVISMCEECTKLTSIHFSNTDDLINASRIFGWCKSLMIVPSFNTSNVTTMENLFRYCESLVTAPLLDTSKVLEMDGMFKGCSSLKYVPLYDISSVTDMSDMFYNCVAVQGGALALYTRASSLAVPPRHFSTFYNCGRDTVTGAAELAQIPSDWK